MFNIFKNKKFFKLIKFSKIFKKFCINLKIFLNFTKIFKLFCKFYINFSKIFQKTLLSNFLPNVPPGTDILATPLLYIILYGVYRSISTG